MIPLTKLNMVLMAPIPSANESTATEVSPGLFLSIRAPYLVSCQIVFTAPPVWRRSRIEDRGSRIEDRGSRIEDRRSRIEDREWRIAIRNDLSSILYPLSSILYPRSSILYPHFP